MNSKLVVGISSRALFDLSESHEIFQNDGVEAYRKYQIKNEDQILVPGEAFNLVNKILKINDFYKNKDRVEVILLSRNTADTGLRIFNSIESHELDISRAVFCGGESPYKYVKAFGVDLFLSSSKDDVKMAIQNSVASARIISSKSLLSFTSLNAAPIQNRFEPLSFAILASFNTLSTESNFSFGNTTTVSQTSRSLSSPHSAFCLRSVPSDSNG